MKALIDCGATAEFIDHEFVHAHELRMYPIPHPISLYNADGSPNEIGKITEAIDLVVQYKGHRTSSGDTPYNPGAQGRLINGAGMAPGQRGATLSGLSLLQ